MPYKKRKESRGKGRNVNKFSVREARQSKQKQMHGEKAEPLGRREVGLCWTIVSSRSLK